MFEIEGNWLNTSSKNYFETSWIKVINKWLIKGKWLLWKGSYGGFFKTLHTLQKHLKEDCKRHEKCVSSLCLSNPVTMPVFVLATKWTRFERRWENCSESGGWKDLSWQIYHQSDKKKNCTGMRETQWIVQFTLLFLDIMIFSYKCLP